MRRSIIALMTVGIVAAIIFTGCAQPAPAPEPTPKPTSALNPFGEDFAVKPDGTPYKFGSTYFFLGNDWMVNAHGLIGSLIERAGGEVLHFDPGCDVARQIGYVEDLIAVRHPDALLIHAVDEAMVAPVCDQAAAAGIAVFPWDFNVPTDTITSYVYHDFDGPAGSCVVGDYFVQVAEETDMTLNIYEVWGMRSSPSSVDRHVGFHRAVDGHPLIIVTESPDSQWSDEVAASLVMDAFTAQPELNALYVHGGGSSGAIEGLRGIGRLLPYGDPDHVIIATNDCDTRVVEAMDDGQLDAFGSHGPRDLVDITVQLAFTKVILGKSVPKDVAIPMTMVTPENIDTLMLFGSLAAWPRMPQGQWDLWPVLDASSIGIEIPTEAMK